MGRDTDADKARTAGGLPRPGESDLLGAFYLVCVAPPLYLSERLDFVFVTARREGDPSG